MANTRLAIIEPLEKRLSSLMRQAGIEVDVSLTADHVRRLDAATRAPDVLVFDLRGESEIPPSIAAFRRHHPATGVVIVAASMDPAMMLDAMRAGVNEFVTEPLDPTELRAAIERVTGSQLLSSDGGRVLAFVGAKGGVGTTTLASNLAAALAPGNPRNVAIVDFHVASHGDVALLLGVEPRFSVTDALENTERLDAAYLKTLVARSKSGVDVLASPERPSLRPPQPDQVRELLSRLTDRYPVTVLDIPPTDFGLIDALDPLTSITIVLNQELPTVRRAAQIGAMLRQRYGKDRVGIVINRYDARADIGQDDIERTVGLPVLSTLPSDYRKVIAAANSGRPVVSDNHSRLASAVLELARRLAGEPAPRVKKPARVGGRLGLF